MILSDAYMNKYISKKKKQSWLTFKYFKLTMKNKFGCKYENIFFCENKFYVVPCVTFIHTLRSKYLHFLCKNFSK